MINFGLQTAVHVTSDSWLENWNNYTTNEYLAVAAGVVVLAAFNLFNLAVITEIAIVRSVNKPVEIAKVISHSLSNIIPIFIIQLLVVIVTFAASILLVVPGIMFMLASYVAIPARIAEPNSGLWGSVKRSFDLTRNHRWALFFLLLVMGIVLGLLTGGIGLGSHFVQQGYVVPDMVRRLTPIGIDSFGTILTNVFTATVYVCLRESRDKMAPDKTAAVFD